MPKSNKRNDADKKRAKRWGSYGQDKAKVFSLVERKAGGRVRSFHVPDVTADTLRPIIWGQIDRKATIHTDEASQYNRRMLGRYARHEAVNHSMGEYVRGDVTTNRIEGYFSILKRGIYGIYQHVSHKHLHRYLAEFDFQNGPDSFVSRDSTDVQGWRMTFIGAGLRHEPDSAEVHSDPPLSNP